MLCICCRRRVHRPDDSFPPSKKNLPSNALFLFQQIFFIDNNVPNYFQLRKLLRGFVSKVTEYVAIMINEKTAPLQRRGVLQRVQHFFTQSTYMLQKVSIRFANLTTHCNCVYYSYSSSFILCRFDKGLSVKFQRLCYVNCILCSL